jgi:hypothetical protein
VNISLLISKQTNYLNKYNIGNYYYNYNLINKYLFKQPTDINRYSNYQNKYIFSTNIINTLKTNNRKLKYFASITYRRTNQVYNNIYNNI